MTATVRRWCVCTCCGKQGWHIGHGWRRACFDRWVEAGKPASGPPPPRPTGNRPGLRPDLAAAARMENFEFLITVRGLKPAEAAVELQISRRTAHRYENRLKEMSNT